MLYLKYAHGGAAVPRLYCSILGCLYTHVLTPYNTDLNKTVLGQKQGKASMESVLWLIAWGDAGNAAAAKQGGITTVNHMDREYLNVIFGVYTKTTTIAYGD